MGIEEKSKVEKKGSIVYSFIYSHLFKERIYSFYLFVGIRIQFDTDFCYK